MGGSTRPYSRVRVETDKVVYQSLQALVAPGLIAG